MANTPWKFLAVALACLATSSAPAPASADDSSDSANQADQRATTDASGPAATVEMTDGLNYAPAEVTIEVGQTVEWRNTSLLVHTVTADPEKATRPESVHLPDDAEPFDSGSLDPKDTFRHTLQTPGRYKYFCVPHEGSKMYGTVVVEPES